MTAVADRVDPVTRARRSATVLPLVPPAVLALLLASWIGMSYSTIGWRMAVLLTVGSAGLVVLLLLAYTDIERFVYAVLLLRPVLDLSKSTTGAQISSSSGLLATGFGAIVIVTGAVWFAALSRAGLRQRPGVVSVALLAMMAASLFSVADSRLPFLSALQVARTLGAVVVYLVLEQLLRTRALALRTLVVCGLSAVAPLLVGLLQMVTGTSRGSAGLDRLTGAFLHPNSFGIFLVVLVVMALAVLPHLSGRPRLAVGALLAVSGLELVLTYSRGSWITLVVGVAVIAALQSRRLFLLFPLAVALLLVLPSVRGRLADLAQGDTVGGRAGNSFTWRLQHIQEILASVHGQTLFGIGPKLTDLLTEGGRPPHNDVVRVFVENGAVGLACYLLLLAGMCTVAVRFLRAATPGLERGIAVGYCGVVAAFVVNSMGANLITQFVILIYVFTLTAVASALGRLARAGRADRMPEATGPHPDLSAHHPTRNR